MYVCLFDKNLKMEKIVEEKIEKWLNGAYDEKTKSELQQMVDSNQEEELTEAFYKDLEFGTGGLRGIMGIGSNRMNKYTVGAATQGLANYINKSFPNEEKKVAIAHDCRNNSDYFAAIVRDVFTANGIKVYFFTEMRPTPELSYTIRHFGCQSGVVLTASHNPKEYNGYKAYWNDGAQVLTPHDKNIIDEVNAITDIADVKFDGNSALVENILEEIDDAYITEIEKVILNKDIIKKQSNVNIVYTSIHGTGIKMVPKTLERLGFTNINIVEEQAPTSGDFPTVVYPNPEEREAMSMALAQGEKTNADLIMATDPDSDRVGIGIKDNHGKYVLMNGNQTGAMIFYYILSAWKENNRFKGNEMIVSTIVTTDLNERIAEHFDVNFYSTLTGFKHIAKIIREKEGVEKFVCGGEESYGYMVGDYARDKDGVASIAVLAEMAAWAKNRGISLFDLLIEIYIELGFYKESMTPLVKKGRSGAEEINKIMVDFRNNPLTSIDGSKIIQTIDYNNDDTGLPKSNVLQFLTEDGTKLSVRPSGTEPKIKFYISVKADLDSKDNFDKVNAELETKIDRINKEFDLV